MRTGSGTCAHAALRSALLRKRDALVLGALFHLGFFAASADGGVRVTLDQPPTPEMRAALVATLADRKSREALEKLLERFELRHQAVVAPSARGVPFAPLPLLCVRDSQGELDLAEKEALLDLAGFSLADASPELPAFVPDSERKPYLDVAEGHLRIEQESAA